MLFRTLSLVSTMSTPVGRSRLDLAPIIDVYDAPLTKTIYGALYQGTVTSTGETVAVKYADPWFAAEHRLADSRRITVAEDMDTEVQVTLDMARHPHANVVGMHPAFDALLAKHLVAASVSGAWAPDVVSETHPRPLPIAVITPWYSGGDLCDAVADRAKGGLLPIHMVKTVFRDVLRGLQHMHAHGWAHLDVSAENILLHYVDGSAGGRQGVPSGRVQAMLTDFGAAARMADDGFVMVTSRGKSGYQAPEVFSAPTKGDGVRVHGPAADVYSAGIVLFMLLAGHRPYAEYKDKYFRMLMAGVLRRLASGPRHQIDARFTRDARLLLSRMLSPDPKVRPSVDALLSSKWLADLPQTEAATVCRSHAVPHCPSVQKTPPSSPGTTPPASDSFDERKVNQEEGLRPPASHHKGRLAPRLHSAPDLSAAPPLHKPPCLKACRVDANACRARAAVPALHDVELVPCA